MQFIHTMVHFYFYNLVTLSTQVFPGSNGQHGRNSSRVGFGELSTKTRYDLVRLSKVVLVIIVNVDRIHRCIN